MIEKWKGGGEDLKWKRRKKVLKSWTWKTEIYNETPKNRNKTNFGRLLRRRMMEEMDKKVELRMRMVIVGGKMGGRGLLGVQSSRGVC